MINFVSMPLVIIILTVASSWNATDFGNQKEYEVKFSGRYRWGEGIDIDFTKAEDAALRDLAQKIYVSLTTSTDRKVIETDAAITETTRMEMVTYTALQLTGLDKLRFTESGKTRVIAFIDTADLSRSFDIARQNVRNLASQALTAEFERRIGDALRLTYWAYLSTFTYLGDDTLNLGTGVYTDARAALADKMYQLVKGLSVQAEPCFREAGTVVAFTRFNYDGFPVQNLSVRYYNGEGEDWAEVKNGQAYLTLYFEPTKRRWPLSISLEYAYPTEMHRRNPAIENLYRILKDRSFDLTLELELIMPWLPEESQASLTTPTPPKPPEPKTTPPLASRWSVIIQVLSGITDSREFRRALQDYADMGYLVYAREASLLGKNVRLFSVILDEQHVYALIYHYQNQLIDTRSGKVFSKLSDAFKGEAYQIWIGELVK